MDVGSPDDTVDWKAALAKFLMGLGLIGLFAGIVLYIALTNEKNPANVSNMAVLVATLQSAFAGIGAVHLTNRTKNGWEVTAIKSLAAACCIGMLGYLVYLGYCQMSVLEGDILVALTALNIVKVTNVSSTKSGE